MRGCMDTPHLLGIFLLVVSAPLSAAADGPVTTVYFGSDARPASECPPPVTLVRRMGDGHEEVVEPLLDCDRNVRPEALRSVSLLARPRGLERPTDEALAAFDRGAHPELLAADVRELHPGLLERLQRLSEALGGHPIEILSGYRPSSPESSRHRHGRALDLRVQGVDRAVVRDVAVGFERSGVGWYPNSVFVHVDVRERSTYWVDQSGPGEPARYVRNARPPGASDQTSSDQTSSDQAPTIATASPDPVEEAPPPGRDELDAIERETGAALTGIRIDAF